MPTASSVGEWKFLKELGGSQKIYNTQELTEISEEKVISGKSEKWRISFVHLYTITAQLL